MNFQKDTGRDTILILVYILTFARRINIDFNSCATHRNEIPTRKCLGMNFQQKIEYLRKMSRVGLTPELLHRIRAGKASLRIEIIIERKS